MQLAPKSKPLLLRGSHVDFFQHFFADQRYNLKSSGAETSANLNIMKIWGCPPPNATPPPRTKALFRENLTIIIL